MTLPASGQITLAQVLAELRLSNPGRSGTISLGDADVRALAGVPSGAIVLSNLYGKSSKPVVSMTNRSFGGGSASFTMGNDGSLSYSQDGVSGKANGEWTTASPTAIPTAQAGLFEVCFVRVAGQAIGTTGTTGGGKTTLSGPAFAASSAGPYAGLESSYSYSMTGVVGTISGTYSGSTQIQVFVREKTNPGTILASPVITLSASG